MLNDKEYVRLFSKITIDDSTGCWIWHGAKTRGYGAFNYRGITKKVHRLMYQEFVGDLPPYNGVNVLDHVVCNNPSCCNPWHVELVKQRFNVLRSNSASAKNSRKTHCIRGHVLPSPGKEGRRCVTCRNINKRRRYHESKSLSITM